MKSAISVATALVWLCLPVFAQGRPDSSSGYSRIVERFEAHEQPALEALLRLGYDSKLPLGVVLVDDALCKRKVSVRASQRSAARILTELIGQLPGYGWSIRNGVAVIAPLRMPQSSARLLNMVVPRFGATRVGAADQVLFLETYVWDILRPSRGSALNILSTPGAEMPPLEMRNSTVEQILSRIVARGAGGEWVLFPVPDDLKTVQRFATAVDYAQPFRIQVISCTPPRR